MTLVKLNFGLMAIAFLFTFKSKAQGGDNATTASGIPITLPFTASGSTVGALNDYNFPTGFSNWSTSGPDWLYYYCAPTAGEVHILLTDMTCTPVAATGILSSITVWNGVPGAGGVLVNSNETYLNSASATQVATQGVLQFTSTDSACYYIMIDNYYTIGDTTTRNGFNYSITIQAPPLNVLQPSCTNMGFETATTSGWEGTSGHTVQDGGAGALHPSYKPAYFGFNSTDFEVTSGTGTDPWGGFPVVCPGFGNNSLRLGDINNIAPGYTYPDYGGTSVEQKFSVTASNSLFTYQYAVVVEDAGVDHPNEEQPFFKAEVIDCNGDPVLCGQYLVTGGPGVPGFTKVGTTNIYYKTWAPVFVDLTAYIGTCVTVKFTTADCSRGGHFAYAYVDAICAPMIITGPTYVCPNTPSTLTSPIGGVSYAWSVVGDPAIIGTSQTLNFTQTLDSVNYQCVITSATGCSTTLEFNVLLYPSVVASSTSITVCEGESATITASVSPSGGTYLWSPSGSITPSITYSPNVTTNYTCTYTDVNGCSDTAVGTININQLPPPPEVEPVNYCLNASTSPLDAIAGLDCSLNWYIAATGGVASSIAPTPLSTATGSTTYYVSQTSSRGCEGPRASILLTINPLPVVNVNSPTICPAETILLTASGAISYVWNEDSTLVINPYSVSPGATTNYAVEGTDINGCKNIANATVSVLNELSITVNSSVLCLGESVTLVPSGATTYSWSSGEVTDSIVVTPMVTTSYVVTGESNGCTGTDTAIVTVNPLPVAPYVDPVFFCQNEVAAPLVAIAAANCTLNWYGTSADGGVSSVSGPVPNTSTVGVFNYYVSQTNTFTGCEGPRSMMSVTIHPLPLVPLVAPVYYCVDDIAVPVTAIVSSGCRLNWYVSSQGGTALMNAPTPSTMNTGTVMYYVSQTDLSTGCEGIRVLIEVIVHPLPPAPGVSTVVYCQNETALPLQAALYDSDFILNWYTQAVGGTPSLISPIPTTTTVGVFTFYVSQVNPETGCESPRVAMNVTVVAPETPLFSIINAICEGSVAPVLPIVSMNVTPISGSWDMSVNTALAGTTTYTFTPNLNQCALPTSLDITIKPLPILNISNPEDVCEPITVDLTNPTVTFGSTGSLRYWQDGAGTIPLFSPSFIDQSGVYFIESTLQGCSVINPVTVVIHPRPIANFKPVPKEVSSLNPYSTMENNSIGAVSYVWDFNGGGNSVLENPSYYFEGEESGHYLIRLIAINEYDCLDTAYSILVVNEELLFYVPNTFTPDKDNFNEVFLPVFTSGFDPDDYTLYIFNRWGELIFESHDTSIGWNGTYGQDQIKAQDASYTWKIIYKLKNNNLHEVVLGHVNVLR